MILFRQKSIFGQFCEPFLAKQKKNTSAFSIYVRSVVNDDETTNISHVHRYFVYLPVHNRLSLKQNNEKKTTKHLVSLAF